MHIAHTLLKELKVGRWPRLTDVVDVGPHLIHPCTRQKCVQFHDRLAAEDRSKWSDQSKQRSQGGVRRYVGGRGMGPP